jgi:WD40 repeat protein
MLTTEKPNCSGCGNPLTQGVCPTCAFGMLLSETPQSLDTEFGRYILKEKLATGGMGVVYAAEDTKLRRTVALKMIRGSSFANDADLARFAIEAESAATLDHPNIVPIYEVGVVEEQPFFTMKLIDGESLAEKLLREKKLAPREIAQLLSAIARAVHHAHQHGVLHRDLKPGNILIDQDGTPWLTDFGLAKIVREGSDSNLTKSSDHLGTPNYMPPELIKGSAREVSTTSDVWALGVILWEALMGELPFSGENSIDIMRKIAEAEPSSPRSNVADRDLITLARRCMEKDPKRRLSSAAELANELDRWLRGEPLHVRPITTSEQAIKWIRRNPTWAALIAAITIGGVTSYLFWQRAETAVESLTLINQQLHETVTISTATKLAADARLLVREDPALALLLAVESVEMTKGINQMVLQEAADSLFDTLQKVGGQDVSPFGTRPSEQDGLIDRNPALDFPVAFAPDGNRILIFDKLSQPGLVAAVFDIAKDQTVEMRHRWSVWPHDEMVWVRALWIDDSHFVLINEDGTVALWTLPDDPSKKPETTILGAASVPGSRTIGSFLQRSPDGSSIIGAVIYNTEGDACSVARFNVSLDDEIRISDVRRNHLFDDTRSVLRFYSGPNLEWFLSWSELGQIQLAHIDGNDNSQFATIPKSDSTRIFHPKFSPDGHSLAMRFGERLIRVYKLEGNTVEQAVESGRDLVSHDASVESMDFSPDSRFLAIGGYSPTVTIAPLKEGGKPKTRQISGHRVLAIVYSDDGRKLGVGSVDGSVSVWDVEDGEIAPTPDEFLGMPTAALELKFGPRAESLAVSGLKSHYRLWRLDDDRLGTIPQIVKGHADPVMDLAVSPDGKWIAQACLPNMLSDELNETGSVKLSSLGGFGERVISTHQERATAVAFDPKGRWLASIGWDGLAKVWDLPILTQAIENGAATPDPIHVLDMTEKRLIYNRSVAFHPRGTLYCTCGDGYLFEWDLTAPEPETTKKDYRVHSNGYHLPDVSVSPDGHWLAVARHGWERVPEEGSTQILNMVLVFDVSQPGPPIPYAELPANFKMDTNVAFSPDSRWVAAGGYQKEGACVWDLSAKDIQASRRVSLADENLLNGVAFSPDGHWLALGRNDGRIDLWDWKDANSRERKISTRASIHSVTWLDATRLVSGGTSSRVSIWETNITHLVKMAKTLAERDLTPDERQLLRIKK